MDESRDMEGSIVCPVMDAAALANIRWHGATLPMSEKMGRLGNAEIDFRTISGRSRPTRRDRQETARFPDGPLPAGVSLTLRAPRFLISRPSHRACAQSQITCAKLPLQSQIICVGNHS
jgi:hypothetical protein